MSEHVTHWRDLLPVHPAADLFPLMKADELRELAEDIRKNGLRNSAILQLHEDWQPVLLDGRNRLDALALLGEEITLDNRFIFETIPADCDPYAYVISLNIHRRHLTAEQRRELIAKLIKRTPGKSDRQIAEQTKSDHKTVGKVRTELEGRGEIPHVEMRTDTRGREQPAHKPPNRFAPDVAMAPHAVRGLDIYQTPPAAVRALLQVEALDETIWECACGPGNIVRVLRDAGHGAAEREALIVLWEASDRVCGKRLKARSSQRWSRRWSCACVI